MEMGSMTVTQEDPTDPLTTADDESETTANPDSATGDCG